MDVFAQDSRGEIRGAAAYALGLLRNGLAVEPLLKSLVNPQEDARVRGFCAEALARIGDRRASDGLITALSDAAIDVRFWSAFALGELREPQALAKLEEIVKHDTANLDGWGSVKEEAAAAILKILNGFIAA